MPSSRTHVPSPSTVSATNPFSLPARQRFAPEFSSWCASALGVSPRSVRRKLEDWLAEDHGSGCVTLWAGDLIAQNRFGAAVIVAKQEFVLSGLALMTEVFRLVSDGQVRVFSDLEDGARVAKGDVVFAAYGNAPALLLGERTALNLGSHLSGVSTQTARSVSLLDEASSRVGKAAPTLLETRKTTPGLRVFEKYATRVGGARNHRHGLDSGAMLKENHLRAAGDISRAVQALKKTLPVLTKIEVEVANLSEFDIALEQGADVIMLDNFKPADVVEAVRRRGKNAPGVLLEVSGNLDARDPSELVSFGVDYVSMGALVHKAHWVDMSLQFYADVAAPTDSPSERTR
jgi:nicotinate-nucleotide pyrophosphorylase (carboxylating)